MTHTVNSVFFLDLVWTGSIFFFFISMESILSVFWGWLETIVLLKKLKTSRLVVSFTVYQFDKYQLTFFVIQRLRKIKSEIEKMNPKENLREDLESDKVSDHAKNTPESETSKETDKTNKVFNVPSFYLGVYIFDPQNFSSTFFSYLLLWKCVGAKCYQYGENRAIKKERRPILSKVFA